MLKKESRLDWLTSEPVFEKTEYVPLTVSTNWVGPAAPEVSGGMNPLWLSPEPVTFVPMLKESRVRSSNCSRAGRSRRRGARAEVVRLRFGNRQDKLTDSVRRGIGGTPSVHFRSGRKSAPC